MGVDFRGFLCFLLADIFSWEEDEEGCANAFRVRKTHELNIWRGVSSPHSKTVKLQCGLENDITTRAALVWWVGVWPRAAAGGADPQRRGCEQVHRGVEAASLPTAIVDKALWRTCLACRGREGWKRRRC